MHGTLNVKSKLAADIRIFAAVMSSEGMNILSAVVELVLSLVRRLFGRPARVIW